MFKKLLILSAFFMLTACGGSTEKKVASQLVAPGIYNGTILPDGSSSAHNATSIITSNGKVWILDVDASESFVGVRDGNIFKGKIFTDPPIPADFRVVNVNNNGASFNADYWTRSGTGSVSLKASAELYERDSSYAKLDDIWVETAKKAIDTETWVIQPNGQFIVSIPNGCAMEGRFYLIDSSKNEYDVRLNLSNCQKLDGDYTGIAVVSDSDTEDDTLNVFFNNSRYALFSQARRQ